MSIIPHASAHQLSDTRVSSPPRGRFSHLAMFRIGSLLFIPAYLSVILYRVLAGPNDDGNPILMAGTCFSSNQSADHT